MRATILRETPLLIGILALIGLETTTVLDWLLLQPALLVLTGLGLLSVLVLLMARGVAHQPINWRSYWEPWGPWCSQGP